MKAKQEMDPRRDNQHWRDLTQDGFYIGNVSGKLNVTGENETVDCTLSEFIDESMIGVAKRAMESGKAGGTIFQESLGDPGDQKRLQHRLKPIEIGDFKHLLDVAKITEYWVKMQLQWPHCRTAEKSALYSRRGCNEQVPHVDASLAATNNMYKQSQQESLFSLSILVAVEDNTRIVVWPGSHRSVHQLVRLSSAKLKHTAQEPPVIVAKELTLRKGQAIVFRQDLVHAGARYSKPNMRLHIYADNAHAGRAPNATWHLLDEQKIFFPRK